MHTSFHGRGLSETSWFRRWNKEWDSHSQALSPNRENANMCPARFQNWYPPCFFPFWMGMSTAIILNLSHRILDLWREMDNLSLVLRSAKGDESYLRSWTPGASFMPGPQAMRSRTSNYCCNGVRLKRDLVGDLCIQRSPTKLASKQLPIIFVSLSCACESPYTMNRVDLCDQ